MANQTFPLNSTILLISHRKDHIVFYNKLNDTYKGYWLRNGAKNCPITIWKDGYNLNVDAAHLPPITSCMNDNDFCETEISYIAANPPFSDIWITENNLIIGTTDMRDGVNCTKFILPSTPNELYIKLKNDGVILIYHRKSKKVTTESLTVQDIITCK